MKKAIVVSLILGATSLLMADGAALYQKCAVCHGKSGEKQAMGNKSKIIKDMTKAEIVAAMKGYKDGTYGGPSKGMMTGQVKNLDDAAIQAIADHIGK
jgi:cytochrome c553